MSMIVIHGREVETEFPEFEECGCEHPACRTCADQAAEEHGYLLGFQIALLPTDEIGDAEREEMLAEWTADMTGWREAIDRDAAWRASVGDVEAGRQRLLDAAARAGERAGYEGAADDPPDSVAWDPGLRKAWRDTRHQGALDRRREDLAEHIASFDAVVRMGDGRTSADYGVRAIRSDWHAKAFEVTKLDESGTVYHAAQHDNGLASCTCKGATLGGHVCKHLQTLETSGAMRTIIGVESL